MSVELKVEVKNKSIQRTKDRFFKLAKRVGDMAPVWKEFIPAYQTIVKGAFDTKGKSMGKSWENYSEAYSKKRKRKTATLRLDDTMYNATQGGSGWQQVIKKQELAMGISGEPYYAIHQYGKAGKMPQRAYFFTVDDDMPPRAWALLLKMTDTYIEGEK